MAPKQYTDQHFSAEVEDMSPDEALRVRGGTARHQRGRPEQAMNDLQRAAGGGVYPTAVEHVGDITHRMNEHGGRLGAELVAPKVQRMRSTLNHPYGFEREMQEQMSDNARYKEVPVDELTGTVRNLGQNYADEHRRTPVYNYPSEVARDASVSLGEQRFDATRRSLGVLQSMEFGGTDPTGTRWAEGDMESLLRPGSPEQNQQDMVDYLRDKESRTPQITHASTSMLGGPRGGQ